MYRQHGVEAARIKSYLVKSYYLIVSTKTHNIQERYEVQTSISVHSNILFRILYGFVFL